MERIFKPSRSYRYVDDLHKCGPKRQKGVCCTFSGGEAEDPIWFTIELAEYFREVGIDNDNRKIAMLKGQLRGEARNWSKRYEYWLGTYDELKHCFLKHFKLRSAISNIDAFNYGEEQKPDEKVADFVTDKIELLKRLRPEPHPRRLVDIIIGQLRPEIRRYLTGNRFADLEQLMDVAVSIEQDLEEKGEKKPSKDELLDQLNLDFFSSKIRQLFREWSTFEVSSTETQQREHKPLNLVSSRKTQGDDRETLNFEFSPKKSEQSEREPLDFEFSSRKTSCASLAAILMKALSEKSA